MAKRFLDEAQVVSVIAPLDLDTDRTGKYVSLKNYGRAVFIFTKSPGTAGDDANLDFQQATDIAGTSAKDLDVVATYWTKQAATDLTGVGTFTENTQSAASEINFNDTSAEQALLAVVEIRSDQLDVNNGFDCVSVNASLDASGGAQYGAVVVLLLDPRYPQSPSTELSAIAD